MPPPLPFAVGEEPPQPRRRRGRGLLIAIVAAIVVVVGGGAAAAFLLMRGAPEQLVGVVPAEADVFATAYLDPSAGQKMNLLALAHRFPDLGSDEELTKNLNDALDDALTSSGLTHQDVLPWVGSQLGVSIEMTQDGTPHAAALIATTDEGASIAAMEKATADQEVRRSDYDGVEIAVASDAQGAYAVVDGVLVLATDEATVKRAIDAAHGTLPNLGDAQGYLDTLAGLPEGKLAIAYVNVRGLVERFGSETAASAAIGTGGVVGLDAISSIGMSVSAQSDGVALDLTMNYDVAKLTQEQRDALSLPDHENTTMAFVPADAFAVVGQEQADVSLQGVLDAIQQQSPEAASAVDEAGLRDFVAAMNGDIAIEVGPGTDGPVSGALLIGTDDPQETESFLHVVAGFAAAGLAQESSGSGFTEDQTARFEACDGTAQQIAKCQIRIINEIDPTAAKAVEPAAPESEEYQGTTIFFLDDPTLGAMGFVPAYAVVDGVGVVATSPEEIHQLIDTEASGDDVRSAPVYTSATASVPTQESVFFLDVQAIAATVREELPPDAQATYDRDVAPNLAPITTFVVGGESDEHHQSVRMFLQIAGAKE